MLPLDSFGYYALASGAAMTLYCMITPILMLPTQIYSACVLGWSTWITKTLPPDMPDNVCRCYAHRSDYCFLFPWNSFIWTRDPVIVEHTHNYTEPSYHRHCLNGLMCPPYALQLAYGWTKLAFYANLIAVLTLVPAIIFLTKWYGPLGLLLFGSSWIAVIF